MSDKTSDKAPLIMSSNAIEAKARECQTNSKGVLGMKDRRLTIRLPNTHPIWNERPGERSRIIKEALRLYYNFENFLKEAQLQPVQVNTPKEEEQPADPRLFSIDFEKKMFDF